jgi:hypothetical protein
MGLSLSSSALDSSQKFTPGFIKNLKMLIKILVVEQLVWHDGRVQRRIQGEIFDVLNLVPIQLYYVWVLDFQE